MGGLTILHNGAPITGVTPGSAPVYVPGFEVLPAAPLVRQGLPGDWLQIQTDGVNVGNANPAVIDVVADPALLLATRGVGENSHVVTLQKFQTGPTGFDPDYVGAQVYVSYSNGNRSVLFDPANFQATDGTARSINARSDKRYIEWLITSPSCNDKTLCGVASAAFNGSSLGSGPSVSYRASPVTPGAVSSNGTIVNTFANYGVGDIIMMFVNPTDGKVWFGKNGTWLGGGDPSTGTNESATGPTGTLYACFGTDDFNISSIHPSSGCTANFKTADIIYPVPTGGLAWDD